MTAYREGCSCLNCRDMRRAARESDGINSAADSACMAADEPNSPETPDSSTGCTGCNNCPGWQMADRLAASLTETRSAIYRFLSGAFPREAGKLFTPEDCDQLSGQRIRAGITLTAYGAAKAVRS